MKKIILMIIMALFALLTVASVFGLTAITDCDGLQDMNNNLAGDYYLDNDIDCNVSPYNTGAGFDPIGDFTTKFTGFFDGKNHTVSNLFINRSSEHYVGLFGYMDSNSQIININLVNTNIIGHTDVGGLVGRILGGNGIVNNSYVSGIVSGRTFVGLLVGNSYGIVTNSHTYGYVTTGATGGEIFGGLVGRNSGGTITKSYAEVTVDSSSGEVGGLVGQMLVNSKIEDCYATGNITGTSSVGGLVGHYYGGITNYCYSTGIVTGSSSVGGLVGRDDGGTTSNSYWDNETSGQSSSAGGTGKTTAEMKQQSTYVSWNFTDIWEIDTSNNDGYPYLGWQQFFEALPTYSNFTSTETTNFSAATLSSVTSLTLAIDNKGKIAFPSDHNINAENENYDLNVKIEDSVIFVNSSALHSTFNNSATLTFYNVDCNKPYVFYSETASTFAAILSENQRCPESLCTNILCADSTLTVDVAHFTGFAVGTDANLTIEAEAGVFYPLDSIEFTAEYINSTDGTPISGECNITFDDEGTWHTMDFNSPDYNYTKSFVTPGLHEYNVTCSSANFVTLEANDTKLVSSVEIPEFSIITLGFGLIAVLIGLVVMRKKK